MLKNLQRIENCVFNAFEKLKYDHKCDIDVGIHARKEYQCIRVYCDVIKPVPSPHVDYIAFVIRTARVYQDVYAYAYNLFNTLLRPYFKK